jgi:Z1 domain
MTEIPYTDPKMNGKFFPSFKVTQKYGPQHIECIVKTVGQLLANTADTRRPAMLLGKIQSGKTRTFEGIMALALDNGYDIVIILTKNNDPLATQTLKRINRDFHEFLTLDQLLAYDIMDIKDTGLTKYEISKKVVLVVKKEKKNLDHLLNLFNNTLEGELKQKRLLIIDDEADNVSVSFKDGMPTTIPSQIDDVRRIREDSSFLQVTATPYCLYLQPAEIKTTSRVFKPMRPIFTSIVPTGEGYVGSEYFFGNTTNSQHPSYYTLRNISDGELIATRSSHNHGRLQIEKVMTSKNSEAIRESILNFIISASILRIIQGQRAEMEKKYSFLIHTEVSKKAHEWQQSLVLKILTTLNEWVKNNSPMADEMLGDTYDRLAKEIVKQDFKIPAKDTVVYTAKAAIRAEYVQPVIVNSDKQTKSLLNYDTGELKLSSLMTVFIGANVLDRGLTIPNMIGFYYGRKPQKFQQDTVLQHMRIMGYRNKDDLVFTRLYTGAKIRDALIKIHKFDESLRERLEVDPAAPIVCVTKDQEGAIIPCSPNKVMLSELSTYKSHSRDLPVGFNLANNEDLKPKISQIDKILLTHPNATKDHTKPFLVNIADALEILDLIEPTLKMEKDAELFIWDHTKKALEMLSKDSADPEQKDKVWILVLGLWDPTRNLSKYKRNGIYSDAPETASTDLVRIREKATHAPGIILVKQSGLKEQGWGDSDHGKPFYWPVIVSPKEMSDTLVFAHEIQKEHKKKPKNK